MNADQIAFYIENRTEGENAFASEVIADHELTLLTKIAEFQAMPRNFEKGYPAMVAFAEYLSELVEAHVEARVDDLEAEIANADPVDPRAEAIADDNKARAREMADLARSAS